MKSSYLSDKEVVKEVSLRLQGYEKGTETLTPMWNPFESRWTWRGNVATFRKLVKVLGIADPKDLLILGKHLRDFKSPIFQHPSLELEVVEWSIPGRTEIFFELDLDDPLHVFLMLSTDYISEESSTALLSTTPWIREPAS